MIEMPGGRLPARRRAPRFRLAAAVYRQSMKRVEVAVLDQVLGGAELTDGDRRMLRGLRDRLATDPD